MAIAASAGSRSCSELEELEPELEELELGSAIDAWSPSYGRRCIRARLRELGTLNAAAEPTAEATNTKESPLMISFGCSKEWVPVTKRGAATGEFFFQTS